MVAKNLKKGDVFEDGGLYYEVQSVNKDGSYISKRVKGPKKKGSKPESSDEEAAEPENT